MEVKNPGNNEVVGSDLHKVIKQNGFANGITGNITFQRGTTDRNFVQMDCVIFNFQGAKFRHVGTMAVETPDFKNCEQYKKAYGTALSKDCKTMIFHGLYEPITVARRSSHSLSICIVVALVFWTDGTANVPEVREFGEFTFSFLCSFVCAVSIFPDIC